jgi:hypothetical protein
MRHPLSAFANRLRDELGLRHEEREAPRWVMRHPLSGFADRLRAKTEVRRKRDVKGAAEKLPTGMGNREWHGVPLVHACAGPPGQRNPRGRDGRRL